MRTIDATDYRKYAEPPSSDELGPVPLLQWLPISQLRIDPKYQREVLRRGIRNIVKIARDFDWRLFGIVVVAPIEGGLFAIVDGQHRTIGAALRDIEQVPCVVIQADPRKQASAFAAINGAVTAISPMQIFYAQLAAGEPDAIGLRDACAAAGVEICRYPVPASKMRPGQTLAVVTMRRAYKAHGAAHLTQSLRCVTCNPKNIGMVNEATVKALCHVLDAEPTWKTPEARLLEAMSRFDFHSEVQMAAVDSKKRRVPLATALSMRLFEYLDAEIGG